jgi:hypothetical protein
MCICALLQPGRFTDTFASTTCSECPVGSSSSRNGTVQCDYCARGKAYDKQGPHCTHYVHETHRTHCTQCCRSTHCPHCPRVQITITVPSLHSMYALDSLLHYCTVLQWTHYTYCVVRSHCSHCTRTQVVPRVSRVRRTLTVPRKEGQPRVSTVYRESS